MSLIQAAALLVPAIRRLRDGRDALLAERDALLLQANAAPRLDRNDLEARSARAESRLIITEYPYHPARRPMERGAGGAQLETRFRAGQDRYAETLHGLARHTDALARIPRDLATPYGPFWANDWFPPFDAASLYGLIAEHAPARYVEVGSGMSTRFARQAITDLGLKTRIISIDPHPHTTCDTLCDEVIRSRMEDLPRSFWEGIGQNDLFFVDNSHRSFPNSDVTVFFTEVLPALRPGAIWGLHDILLPYDYPEEWRDRFYNEQYLLAAYLLGGAGPDRVLLPNRWVFHQPALHGIMAPLWARDDLLHGLGTHGACFWMQREPA